MAGPSGLCIEATVVLTLQSAGNGHSTNGSSDTLRRPRKRQRDPSRIVEKNGGKSKASER